VKGLVPVVALLWLGCATTEIQEPRAREDRPASLPSRQQSLQLQMASDVEVLQGSRIVKADLERARALLTRARQVLQPPQWELLDRKLRAAEGSWARYETLARASGKPAGVPRSPAPVLGLVGARTASAAAEVSSLNPLLLALGTLWPAELGNGELTPRLNAELNLEASLRELVAAGRVVETQLESSKRPPGTTTSSRGRPGCEPIPVPHLGGDVIHDTCADVVPPNRFPGQDVLVMDKRFDALQADANVLWEIKTDRFDTYVPFLQKRTVESQVPELRREREIATACGYGFVVGVSSAAHAEALRLGIPGLDVRLTGC